MDTYEPYELTRLENVALDVARAFGNESTQSIERMYRFINRAGIYITGSKRRWSWQFKTDYFETTSDQADYSLNSDVKRILSVRLEGSYRGPLEGMTKRKFREIVPDATISSGTPTTYIHNGVDSNGSKVLMLWPIPDDGYEVHYDYFSQIVPLKDAGDDILSKWGMPIDMLNVLIQTAYALSLQGVDGEKFDAEMARADAMIFEAYEADQENIDTEIRADANEPDLDDGPVLPPNYGV